MRRLCLILVLPLLLCAAAPTQARTLYVLGWASALPVELTKVEVRGGALVEVWEDSAGTSGVIGASAPLECLTIEAEGQTTTGVAVVFARFWDAGCEQVWLPIAQGP